MKKFTTLLFALLLVCTAMTAQKNTGKCTLNVATFNLRLDTPNDGKNAWPNRKEMVKDLVRFYDFDIMGTQEGFKHMLDGIGELNEYTYFGRGRDDGKDGGEHSAIFYKKKRFVVLDHGDFWFSETPDKPGLGWDAVCNRICTWGKFRDKQSGKVFFVFNSHFDHKGVAARRNSSLLLLKNIKKITDGKYPVFVTGDFNAVEEDEPIQVLLKDGLLKDAYHETRQPAYGTIGTYNGFDHTSEMKSRIDHIFITRDIKVEKYGVLNDMKDGRYPSDHFPVMIKADF